MIGNQDEEYAVSLEEAGGAAMEMYGFANHLAEERLAEPQDDLMSAILHGEVDGQRLNLLEFDAFFLLLAVAGNETTRNLISQGMLLLLDRPDVMQRLRDDRRTHTHGQSLPGGWNSREAAGCKTPEP